MILFAYTDPGTGALIWQLVGAGVVGSLFYVKQLFRWVKSRFSKEKDQV